MVAANKLRPGDSQVNSSEMNLYLNVIAHEIRNPLVSVQGYAALLQEKYGRSLPREGRDYLNRIGTNLKRLEMLLTDITQFARITIDETRFTKVSMSDLVEAAVEIHLFQLHQSNIRLQIMPGLPALYCDSKCMVLVFSNLICNAIKYSSESKDGRIEVGYLNDEIFHKFYVKDNGVGFRARDRKKVFQIFHRLRNKKNVSGSGLGLSIVKQIVEGHGGEVWVESRKNCGATFFFTLPQESRRT